MRIPQAHFQFMSFSRCQHTASTENPQRGQSRLGPGEKGRVAFRGFSRCLFEAGVGERDHYMLGVLLGLGGGPGVRLGGPFLPASGCNMLRPMQVRLYPS